MQAGAASFAPGKDRLVCTCSELTRCVAATAQLLVGTHGDACPDRPPWLAWGGERGAKPHLPPARGWLKSGFRREQLCWGGGLGRVPLWYR
jgi:hypothetical protein